MNLELFRPNIFDYATRELSQDAMICWLLACLHSKDETYKKIGVDFIRFVLQDGSLTENEIALESSSPHKQYYKMDVYAVVKVRNKIVPIIFEDKTNTYLHSDQFESYCKMVHSWLNSESYLEDLKRDFGDNELVWGNILYVYFKTGYVPGWQEVDFKNQAQKITTDKDMKNVTVRSPIYIEDITNFVEKHTHIELLSDYLQHLKQVKCGSELPLKYWNDDSNELNYKYCVYEKEPSCDMLFQSVFGDKEWFNYNHQGWASRDLFYIKQPEQTNENRLWYCFRFDCWKYQKGEYRYAFALQQYRDEKNVSGNKEKLLKERAENSEQIKEICHEIFEELQSYNITISECKSDKISSQNNLFKFFIADKNKAEDVCRYLNEFKTMFIQKVCKVFGDKIVVL